MHYDIDMIKHGTAFGRSIGCTGLNNCNMQIAWFVFIAKRSELARTINVVITDTGICVGIVLVPIPCHSMILAQYANMIHTEKRYEM